METGFSKRSRSKRRPVYILVVNNPLRSRCKASWIALFASQGCAATDPLIFGNRVRINALALEAHLATIYGGREYVDAGALMSYGPYWVDRFRHAADQVLRGAKPADIPVEQPTKFYLVINRRTAAALGLTVPSSLLATADEVIE